MLFDSIKRKLSIRKFIRNAAYFNPFEIRKYSELYSLLCEKRPVRKSKSKKLGLRLLIISDTHGYMAFGENRLPSFLDTIGEFDLCILLGDIHPAEMPLILDCIPVDKIIAIKGNHDSFSAYSEFGIRDISGTAFDYNGVRFVGIDGSFRYKNKPFPSYTQYESLALAHKLPEADVLLTHDIMLENFEGEPSHSGLIGITYYIYSKYPDWHIHGHVHRAYEKQYENGTKEKSVYLFEYMEI